MNQSETQTSRLWIASIVLIAAAVALMCSCDQGRNPNDEHVRTDNAGKAAPSEPLNSELGTRNPEPAPSPAPAPFHFTDVTASSGVLPPHSIITCGENPATEILEVNGGGLALIDFDNDGDFDLFIANGATMNDPEHGPGCRLYENLGNLKFADITEKAHIDVHRWATGVAVGDYDGDGFDDLYICCYGPNILLHNNGDGTFTDVTARAFADPSHTANPNPQFPKWSASAAFGDLDNDGDLDLYVCNYLDFDIHNRPPHASYKGVEVMAGPHGLNPQYDLLYENLGDGTFRDITASSGCRNATPSFGLNVVIIDFDDDGQQDIFVCNDSMPDFLFHNVSDLHPTDHQPAAPGDTNSPASRIRFEEIGIPAGIASNADGGNQASMGIAIADVDGNGLPDKFTTVFSSDTNALHMNVGQAQQKAETDKGREAERQEGREAGRQEGRKAERQEGNASMPNASMPNASMPNASMPNASMPDASMPDASMPNASMPRPLDASPSPASLLFEDRAQQYGLAMISRPYLGWSCGFSDFDLDGYEDLFFVNGHVYPQATRESMDSEFLQTPLLFQRAGNRFKRITPDHAGPWLAEKHRDRNALFADLDNDGDIDIIIGELNGPIRIIRNDTLTPRSLDASPPSRSADCRWLIVELRDNRPGIHNRRGLGSKIELTPRMKAERQEGRKAERQEGREAERQEGREAERQEGREAERQEGREAERQEGRKAERQEGREAERQEGREAERQEGREAEKECLNASMPDASMPDASMPDASMPTSSTPPVSTPAHSPPLALTRWLFTGGGFQSSGPPQAHFGLGCFDPQATFDLDILWPDGHHQHVANVKANQRVTVERDASEN